MTGNTNVFNIETIRITIGNLNTVSCETEQRVKEALNGARAFAEKTQEELKVSEMLLDAVRAEEAIKLARQIATDVRMATAVAEEASAIASMNPVAIAAASAEVAATTQELAQATEEYQQAVEHRQRLEHRVELAQKCVNIAQEMFEMLQLRFNYSRAKVVETVHTGVVRLQLAYDDLTKYLSRHTALHLQEIGSFDSWKPAENTPVKPKEVHDRLNVSESVANAILQYLYVTDIKFRSSIDRLCAQFSMPGNAALVETQIKKNIVGRLSEEIVIRCFTPLGERVETQSVFYLEDGSYTKADMILYNLTEPLILGRGEGMGATKGGNLGIEVKTGNKEYIYAQLSHMEKQAQGHSQCELSCTICSRDITDLSPEKEAMLRNRLREAGSPMLGMLPYKAVLDADCIEFVKEKAGMKNV